MLGRGAGRGCGRGVLVAFKLTQVEDGAEHSAALNIEQDLRLGMAGSEEAKSPRPSRASARPSQ
jgi:hypothetical protein